MFENRLRQRIKLQSDPTIIYGLVGGKGTLGRPIMRSEIEQPTPYNTYAIEGLAAGADRQSGPRVARGDGKSRAHQGDLFSSLTALAGTRSPRTLPQHQQNVAKLRQFEQQVRTPARDAAAPGAALQFTEPTLQSADPVPQIVPAPAAKTAPKPQQKPKAKAPLAIQ